MTSAIFDKMLTAVKSGALFSHSIVDLAVPYIEAIPEEEQQQVNIAVIGDSKLLNAREVSRHLTSYLRFFELKSNIRLLTGDRPGLEAIVQRYAKNSGLDCVVYKTPEVEGWGSTAKKLNRARDEELLKHAHVVLVITNGSTKDADFMYKLARDSGRLVSKRQLKGSL